MEATEKEDYEQEVGKQQRSQRKRHVVMSSLPPSERYNHSFRGWSVWIEPCEDECDDINKEIQFLAKECGGSECGIHPFVPHCTLLYNLTLVITKTSSVSEQEVGEQLLIKCHDNFVTNLLMKQIWIK